MPYFLTAPLLRVLPAAAAAALIGVAAHAVTPDTFTHTTEADFADGDAQDTVVTNLGDIKLSSDTQPIEGLPDDVTVIHDVVKAGDETYISVGPETKILRLTGDGVEVVAEYKGEQVFTLAAFEGDLLIGVSAADHARIDVLTPNGIETEVKFEDETYIWDLLVIGPQNNPEKVLVATGPNGKVYAVSEQDKAPKLILETAQDNILSLAADAMGNVYAGTDTDGLIYRIDPNGEPFVVYDAPEAEIASLVVMDDGTVYAGTAAADQAKPGRLEQPVKNEEGRPAPPEEGVDGAEGEGAEDQADPQDEAEADAGDADAADEEAGEEEAAEDDTEQEADPETTPEQYDALREALRNRLQEARETGSLTGDGGLEAPKPATNQRATRAKAAAPAQRKSGNAVYKIAPDGFVSEVFRESAMILAIVPHDGKLIIATGNDGQVYSVDPAINETTVLTDLESAQVTCAMPTDRGLLLGASNPAALVRMSADVAEQGTYTSRVLDAGQISLYGIFKLTAEIPQGTAVKVELRSGNVGDPELAAWSKWSAAATIPADPDANPLQPRELRVSVPPARYLQYRLSLTSADNTTPVIDQVDIAYVAPNTPPVVEKLVAKPAPVKAPGEDPDPKVTIQWQASDGNEDRLLYDIEYKPGKADRYLPLAEDLTQPKYDWQTQHVPDGWYTVRVTAHDRLDNPPTSAKSGGRISEPLLIDNTPPTLENLKAQVKDGSVVLSAKVVDELSTISSVAYSINGSETYQASLPDDLIYDSTSEAWGVTIPDLSPGGHVIAVRAIDAKGNTAYRQLIVNVE